MTSLLIISRYDFRNLLLKSKKICLKLMKINQPHVNIQSGNSLKTYWKACDLQQTNTPEADYFNAYDVRLI